MEMKMSSGSRVVRTLVVGMVVVLAAAGGSSARQLEPYRETIEGTLVGFDMMPVSGGAVTIPDPAAPDGERVVEVAPFWMGKTEVTWDEFDIWLLGLDREPERPRDEVAIAVAGPLVSVGLGILFSAAAALLPAATLPAQLVGAVFRWLGTINLALAAFNAVPGFPLDGGRVLRGIAWAVTGSFARATGIAAAVGAAFAWSLIGFGALAAILAGQVLGGLWMVFIGWFLLSAARSTVGQVMLQRILSRVRVLEAMESARGACLSGSETVEEVVREALLRRGLRTFFVIGPREELTGLLSLRELAAVPAERRGATPVREIMLPVERLTVLSPAETGWNALEKMTNQRVNQLPVVDRGRLVGVITREQLLSLVQAGLALGVERSPESPPRSTPP